MEGKVLQIQIQKAIKIIETEKLLSTCQMHAQMCNAIWDVRKAQVFYIVTD